MLTFSIGKKKLFGSFGDCCRTTPVVPGVAVRLRSPVNPLLRLLARRRGFLSRNSTSSRSTALLSGKLILRLSVPPNFCNWFAIAGGSSTKFTQIKFIIMKYVEWINQPMRSLIKTFNEWNELNTIPMQLNSTKFQFNNIPFKISCSKLAVGTTITNTTPGIMIKFITLIQRVNKWANCTQSHASSRFYFNSRYLICAQHVILMKFQSWFVESRLIKMCLQCSSNLVTEPNICTYFCFWLKPRSHHVLFGKKIILGPILPNNFKYTSDRCLSWRWTVFISHPWNQFCNHIIYE